jgi:hypothetical protein
MLTLLQDLLRIEDCCCRLAMRLGECCIRTRSVEPLLILATTDILQELAELAGHTARVSDLFEAMDEVKTGNYHKKLVSSSSVEENARSMSMCIVFELRL